MTNYTPNKNNIDIVAAEIVRLSEEFKRLGIDLEDFCGGIVSGVNSVLATEAPPQDSRRSRIVRLAMLVGIKHGLSEVSHGNGQRVH